MEFSGVGSLDRDRLVFSYFLLRVGFISTSSLDRELSFRLH